jgi:Peptidase inhibitor I78 family
MRGFAMAALMLAVGACMQAPQTYRDLDRLGRDYQRDVAAAPANAEEATRRDTCGANAHRHLIGAPAAAIDRASLPPATRIITPDMMVTQDFSPNRLNIMVGTDGKVGSLACY